ncbi:nucleotidyltransferase substrate binding protein [Candidatus Poribacteria bacterium]|nr:nucleotidyltransferase substrate binding protein [Candidatus Poribacteria bacterium]
MDKLRRTFERFERAFRKYEEVVKTPALFSFLSKELLIEVTTKRFEYTYESMWQSLREYLRGLGMEVNSPLRCFKEAFKEGLIPEENEGMFSEIVRKRNEIVHIYDEEKAQEIFMYIGSDEVYNAIRSLYETLKRKISEEKG